ncbi:hypothetical protein [Massilia soli]|uniref:DUF4376 domain-containing protein n=1 Tax=Massilia soli TaxID=2792854 RepID=A0ABS7SRA0_9BURK|nr:hypothetical protein [Massilia soli]MBZ2208466.1 hypothetical protein [Massilia soli]
MYIHPASQTVFADHSEIRSGLNVLFSDVITDEDLAYHGVFPVAQVDPAAGPGQVAVPGMPVQLDGEWMQTWTLRDETPEEAAAKIAESVPMLNLQLVLIEDAKLDTVQAILDSMTGADGAKARAYWAKALTARRDNYLVAQLWQAIGYDEAGFNAAWARAAALNP